MSNSILSVLDVLLSPHWSVVDVLLSPSWSGYDGDFFGSSNSISHLVFLLKKVAKLSCLFIQLGYCKKKNTTIFYLLKLFIFTHGDSRRLTECKTIFKIKKTIKTNKKNKIN
uniref:Uncharacterized protein n=1 Tax=Micrurus corallinus TaxID=54390 RepID=A0A2D4GBA8_MICCO